MNQIFPIVAIVLGIALAIAIQAFIFMTLRHAIHPRWQQAFEIQQLLKKHLGISSRVQSVDATNIIRLVVLNDVPVATMMDDIKKLINQDVRLETDKHHRSVLAILPQAGIRKPARKAVQPKLSPQATPA